MNALESVSVGLMLLLASACAGAQRPSASARSQLLAADRSVTWSSDSAVVGDIDCDGKADTAMLGHGRNDIRVGIVFGAPRLPDITAINIAPATQGALPTGKVRLKVESIDYDPAKDEGGAMTLEGFQRSKACIGLNLSDGMTDSMHMYWNHVSHHLDWWRR